MYSMVERPPVRAITEHLSRRPGEVHQPNHRLHHLAHVGEAARLAAVVINGDRGAPQPPLDEPRDHHAIVPHLAGTDHVEEAANHRGQPIFFVVSQGQKLIDRLRDAVGPAGMRGGSKVQFVFFGPRFLQVFPIDFAGRGEEEPAVRLGGQPQQRLGRLDVGFDGPHRILGHQLDPHRRREVIDHIDPPHHLSQQWQIGDRTRLNGQLRMPLQVGEVVELPGREIVEHTHRITQRQQPLGEMAADETGSPGDQTE